MPNRPTREESRHREDALLLSAGIRAAREKAGMSQERLAQISGVSIGSVRAIETVRVVEPGVFTVDALTKALGILIAEVLPSRGAGKSGAKTQKLEDKLHTD